jgi:4-amino-4-deoxy-L-arabinose transferase-like glycosyltransferase
MGDAAYRRLYCWAIAFALLFFFAHLVALPVRISYDGIGYVDLADVLFSGRFPQDWASNRTPLFPLALKVSFRMFGKQPAAAVLVTSTTALFGILLMGATVRRLVGELAAALTIVALSLFPTLVAYEHSVLTEAGTFFFVAALLYLLLSGGEKPRSAWYKTGGLVAVLAAGYYWRANVMVLAPVAAVLHLAGAWQQKAGQTDSGRRRRALAQAALILAGPVVLSWFWTPYSDQAGLRDVTLKQGMLRQALLPPEHPLVGDQATIYYAGIRESLYHGNFYSGMKWNYMTLVSEKVFDRPLGRSVPRFFLDLVVHYPGRYASGLGRTLVFFAGVNGVESDNRICRDEVLTPGAKISEGPEPLRSRVRSQFQQPPAPSVIMGALRGFAPVYDAWVIAASLITVACLPLALYLRDVRLLICCLLPLAYALSYAVLLVSLDRFVLPVYPIVLANSIIAPPLVWRALAARR